MFLVDRSRGFGRLLYLLRDFPILVVLFLFYTFEVSLTFGRSRIRLVV